ncbi:hypothetical protein DY000_02052240 [Brassica cretica]|uniref:Uncharacterized protein n=1 Tax=Brassica cretica TaxID=69181 RepID=A0ABQ7A9F1_BRACR|nr:hypothetical protein DY000_02052240 [Brassica cretica]
MKNGEMKQSKKLLEDIAGIAGNCLTVCPSHEGKSRLHLREQNKCGSGYMVVSHGILRQFPQESPLANGQILIDGQVLIRLLAGSMTNRRVQVVDGDAHVSVFGDILIQEGMNKGCVESLSSSDGWMVGSVLGNSVFKEFDSRLSAHGWNRKAKEEINLQKDVQVSIQAFEQIRDFDSKVLIRLMASSMTKRRVQLVDGDAHVSAFWRHINKRKQYKVIKCNMFNYIKGKSKTVSEIWSMSDFKNLWTFIQGWNQKAKEEINLQKDVQVSVQALDEQVEVMETHNGLKKIMKGVQVWLKVELREVSRDKRRKGDAEDEQVCSTMRRSLHKGRVMDLDQTVGVLMNKGCVESLSSSDGWMVGSVLGNSVFKEFDSRLSAHGWNRKAKEEINLQKDVQVSIQAFEQIRDFDSKLGSQLKIIDEGDGYSEWQWDCRIPFIRRLKKIMKELQAWLKVELREVRRNKRRQGDAEDEQAYSNIKRCRHKVRVMDLDQTGFTYSGTERVYDLVNHIGDVFRYFIVDTVDPGSTPDVANCGRELGEKFLSQEQR